MNCNETNFGIAALSLTDALKILACDHKGAGGGNDYIMCMDCGLVWDYRKMPEKEVLRRVAEHAQAILAQPPRDGLDRGFASFGRAVYGKVREIGQDWWGDEWSIELMPLAVEHGLAREEPYDPEVHTFDCEADPGENIWVWNDIAALAPTGTAVSETDLKLKQGDANDAELKQERPKIVCLCGSTRFYDEFQRANYERTMAGEIVLSVGFYPHAKAEHGHGEGVGHDSAEKVMLDDLHFRKIDLADEVYVLNVGGYIGESTAKEACYAYRLGKLIRFLDTAVDMPCCARCWADEEGPCMDAKCANFAPMLNARNRAALAPTGTPTEPAEPNVRSDRGECWGDVEPLDEPAVEDAGEMPPLAILAKELMHEELCDYRDLRDGFKALWTHAESLKAQVEELDGLVDTFGRENADLKAELEGSKEYELLFRDCYGVLRQLPGGKRAVEKNRMIQRMERFAKRRAKCAPEPPTEPREVTP